MMDHHAMTQTPEMEGKSINLSGKDKCVQPTFAGKDDDAHVSAHPLPQPAVEQ